MFGDGRLRRLAGGIGAAVMLLAGCNWPAPAVVGTLPHEGADDLSDLQGSGLPDECLVGNWTMRTADLDIFIATLLPLPNLRVPSGSLYIIFGALGEYSYGADAFSIRIDLGPDKYLQGTASFLTSGIYSTATGELVLTDSGSRKEITEWKAVKGSEVVVAPGAGPEFSLIPNGPLPYECTAEELVLQWAGPSGSAVPMIFKRETP